MRCNFSNVGLLFAADHQVGDTGLTFCKHNILKLLDVYFISSKYLEDFGKNANFIFVSNADLLKTLILFGSVHGVLKIDLASLHKLLDHSQGFSTDGILSLGCACTAVVGTVAAGVL